MSCDYLGQTWDVAVTCVSEDDPEDRSEGLLPVRTSLQSVIAFYVPYSFKSLYLGVETALACCHLWPGLCLWGSGDVRPLHVPLQQEGGPEASLPLPLPPWHPRSRSSDSVGMFWCQGLGR